MVALLFMAACDDDGNGVTGPVADSDWPSVTITSAPDASRADHEVALEFTVSDDVELDLVTVNWGVPGEPVETIPLDGKSFSGTCVHSFSTVGQFQIVLQVRDESGRMSTATHEISITPPPPAAPIGVAVEVKGTRAIVTWTPGTWATSQGLTLTRLDQVEPVQTRSFSDGVLASFIFTDLSWDASYTIAVSAVNSLGREESEPVSFQTPPPVPSTLTRFSAVAADPTCLALEWTLGSPADETRVAITGDTEADSFEETYAWTVSEAELCAAMHPIVDGMTYTAQVFSVLGDKEYASNTLEYTVDFNPPSDWANGSWTATWMTPEGEREILWMELEDADGVISGTWESDFFTSQPSFVTGTRTFSAIDLTLHFTCYGAGVCPPNSLVGEFTDPDTIEAQLDVTWFDMPLTIRRD